MEGRTTLIVAHRLATISLADRVAVIDEGRVIAEGTHAELLAGEPRYAEILAHTEEDARRRAKEQEARRLAHRDEEERLLHDALDVDLPRARDLELDVDELADLEPERTSQRGAS